MILLSTARAKKPSSNFHKFGKSGIFLKKEKAEAVARPLFFIAKQACAKINKIDNAFKRGLIEKER